VPESFVSPFPYEVPESLHGEKADAVLEVALPKIRRTALRRLIANGQVFVNGRPLDRPRKLRANDQIDLDPAVDLSRLPRIREKRLAKPETLFEDAACLVIAKPSELASVPDRHGEASVHGMLGEWFGDVDLRFVHRLDRGTSGALLLAKGRDAARALEVQFRERRVEKHYFALVHGQPPTDEFACDVPIGRTIRGGRVKAGEAKGSREAHTAFIVLERFRGYALLEARPTTGRMHQIRVHLKCLRLPLAVDPMYGGAKALWLSQIKPGYRAHGTEQPLIDRLALHAHRLVFVSPAGSRVEVSAELPKDFRITLEKLRRFASVGAGDRRT